MIWGDGWALSEFKREIFCKGFVIRTECIQLGNVFLCLCFLFFGDIIDFGL